MSYSLLNMALIHCECGYTIDTPPEWDGKKVCCPECSAIHAIAGATRTCPNCSERIQGGAVKCRYCAEPLTLSAPRRMPLPRRVDTWGVGILVVGILSWVVCGLLGPVAWAMGSSHESRCRTLGMEPGGTAKAGKILGMIMSFILLAAGIAIGTVAVMSAVLQ